MSVCQNQDAFNDAFYKAIKEARKKEQDENSKNTGLQWAIAIYALIHIIFLVWGVFLAINSQPPENRVLHLVLAIIFAPLYVISYYIGQISSGK
jgi:bacteriorhodopsin